MLPPDIGDTQEWPPPRLSLVHHEHAAKFLGFLGVDIHLENHVGDPVILPDLCFQLLVVLNHCRDDARLGIPAADPEGAASLDLLMPAGQQQGNYQNNKRAFPPCQNEIFHKERIQQAPLPFKGGAVFREA